MSDKADKMEVVLFTNRHQVKGHIALFADTRLTDYMVEAKSFIAIINATVMDISGRLLFKSKFVNVQRDHIEMIVPADLISKKESP